MQKVWAERDWVPAVRKSGATLRPIWAEVGESRSPERVWETEREYGLPVRQTVAPLEREAHSFPSGDTPSEYGVRRSAFQSCHER